MECPTHPELTPTTPTQRWRWPQKVSRFRVEDPLLRYVVARYEREIPWHTVTDAETLAAHVRDVMLPDLLDRVAWPLKPGARHCFVDRRHVDVDLALTTDPELDQRDLAHIGALRRVSEAAALSALVDLVNVRKARAFAAWTDLMADCFGEHPALAVLLLRPLFERARAGDRRSVVAPSEAITRQVHEALSAERVTPNADLAHLYTTLRAASQGTSLADGWHHVPRGSLNASRLTALSLGSGWCVANGPFAVDYLRSSAFYILRVGGRPEVALRFRGRHLVECVGRGNAQPSAWSADIILFLETHAVHVPHLWHHIGHSPLERALWLDQPASWWRERVRRWPFAAALAPMALRVGLTPTLREVSETCGGFPQFDMLSRQLELPVNQASWRRVLGTNPLSFEGCPEDLRDDLAVQAACVRGWEQRAARGRLSDSEVARLPDFVRRAPTIALELAREAMPEQVAMLKRGRSHSHRESCLPSSERERPDFATRRIVLWEAAIAEDLAMWFALPDDLRALAQFTPAEGPVAGVCVERWVDAITEAPWRLQEPARLPRRLRFHRALLDAYVQGWAALIREGHGLRIRSIRKRRYSSDLAREMSLAILNEPAIVDAMATAFARSRNLQNLERHWRCVSDELQRTIAVQVAVMRAAYVLGAPFVPWEFQTHLPRPSGPMYARHLDLALRRCHAEYTALTGRASAIAA